MPSLHKQTNPQEQIKMSIGLDSGVYGFLGFEPECLELVECVMIR